MYLIDLKIHRKQIDMTALEMSLSIIQLYKLLPQKFLHSLTLSGSKSQDTPENSIFKRLLQLKESFQCLSFQTLIDTLIFDFLFPFPLLSTSNLSATPSMPLQKSIPESFFFCHLNNCSSSLVSLHSLSPLLLYMQREESFGNKNQP